MKTSPYWHAVTLQVPPEAVEMLNHHLFELGTLGTVEEAKNNQLITVKAYFSATDYTTSQLQSLLNFTLQQCQENFPGLGAPTPEIASMTYNDWGENWKQYFKPFYLAPEILITPSWETPEPAPGDTVIHLEPGMAFGTGLHPTTQLCTQLLLQELKRHPGATVLDVGCGSGILSLVAAKQGAQEIVAVDIDSAAVEACQENAGRNGLTNRITTSSSLEQVDGSFQIVLANLLLTTLLELRSLLLTHLAPQGVLIASGVLEEHEKDFLRHFESPFLKCVRKEYQEEWGVYLFSA